MPTHAVTDGAIIARAKTASSREPPDARMIADSAARVAVRVIPTAEELMVARAGHLVLTFP
jgi:acetate kinase